MTISSLRNISTTFAVSLMLSAGTHAAVEVSVPEEINLHVVNLERPNLQGSVFSSSRTLELPNGLNQIAFRYSYNFVNRDTAERVSSKLIVMKFEASDQTLSFTLPKYRDAKEAEREIDNFQWHLVDTDTQKEIDAITDSITVSGFVLGQNFNEEVEGYNKKGGKAAIGLTYVTIANPSTTPGTSQMQSSSAAVTSQIVNKKLAEQGSLVGSLQSLYLQASKEERKAFQKWMIDQE